MGLSEAAEPADLQIRGLSKAFGRFAALSDVALLAGAREFVALLGPSGAGKTTFLRVLAGLERPDAGEVVFQGEDFLGVPARRRRVGVVFQSYALFRHMTVGENVAFGLAVKPRSRRPPAQAIRARVAELLALVRLEGIERRYPAQLSGGQRQRVALARALAIEPRMLLLDEPFGALDSQVRRELRRWLREAHDAAGVTTVFVTHDQEEALDLADRVAILKDGRIVQSGAPQAIYEAPASAFVYEFLGPFCRVKGEAAGGRLSAAGWTSPAPAGAPAGPVEVYFRPDEVELGGEGAPGLQALVRGARWLGTDVRLDCEIMGAPAELRRPAATLPPEVTPGARIRVRPLRPMAYAASGS